MTARLSPALHRSVAGRLPMLAVLGLATASCARAAEIKLPEAPEGFVVESLATGLNAVTAMAAAADGRIFIAEQTGAVKVWKDGRLLPAPALDLSVRVDDYWERGLVGLALHPTFRTRPTFSSSSWRGSRFPVTSSAGSACSEKLPIPAASTCSSRATTSRRSAARRGAAFVPDADPFPRAWRGRFFFADWAAHWMKAMDVDSIRGVGDSAPQPATVLRGLDYPVAVQAATDGSLLVLNRGAIWRDGREWSPTMGCVRGELPFRSTYGHTAVSIYR